MLAASQAKADQILYVGTAAGDLASIAAAVTVANGDTANTYVINVAPGTYSDQIPEVTVPLTIQLDPSFGAAYGSVVLNGPVVNDKGIITADASLTVNGLTFENAAISAALGENGAGIRDQATGAAQLIVENSFFLNNQDGILVGDNAQQTVSISNSTFIDNGVEGSGLEHAIYVNHVAGLTVTGSVFCGTKSGHDIKSRAASTTISDNQLFDGASGPAVGGLTCDAGTTSYAIDLPNGGTAEIDGNTITQGSATQNPALVSYGEEGLSYTANSLLVTDNLFASSGVNAVGIQELSGGSPSCLVPVQLSGNTFTGVATPINPADCTAGVTPPPTDVPEPASLWLIIAALLGWAGIAARTAVADQRRRARTTGWPDLKVA